MTRSFLSDHPVLGSRLKKRYKHLRKWAKRTDVSCFRLYERDIPEFPCIVDWYEGHAVVWVYQRKKDETEAQQLAFLELVQAEVQEGLQCDFEHVHLKHRFRQRDDQGQRSQYDKFDQKGVQMTVQEQGLQFKVNLSDFLDTGLFLDHRIARNWVRDMSSGLRVLNLFAYTGSFSVYAAAGGATSVTSVDLSNTYSRWTEENLALNAFDTICDTQVIAADVLSWLAQAKKEGREFDLVICDPPTFSNSKKMNEASFVIDRDYPWLIADICKLLSPEGVCFFSNNSRKFDWDDERCPDGYQAEEVSHKSVPEDFRNRKIHRSWWIRPS
jgi:23S rRNA G2069 N7-methylase RlmK/C1962 C5-methylase RlmI